MAPDELIGDAGAHGRVGEMCLIDDVPRSIWLVRERYELPCRKPRIIQELRDDELTVVLADITEGHGHSLARGIIEILSWRPYRSFFVDFKGIENGPDNRAKLPCFKVISDEAIGHVPQRTDLDEEQQLVDAKIGDVELDRVEIREEKVADLASFIHDGTVPEFAFSSIAAAAPSLLWRAHLPPESTSYVSAYMRTKREQLH